MMKQTNIFLEQENDDYINELKKVWNFTNKNNVLNKIIEEHRTKLNK